MNWSTPTTQNQSKTNYTPFRVGNCITFFGWIYVDGLPSYLKIESINGRYITGSFYANKNTQVVPYRRIYYVPGYWMVYEPPVLGEG